MTIDPDLAAVLLAVVLGTLPALVTGGRAVAARRRLKHACAVCGRRVVQGRRTCACDS